MIVAPAIDVRSGRVVRLLQGDARKETVYDTDPAAVAQRFERDGARRLHLVDLDGALDARPQVSLITSVLAAVKVPVEVGGGLRHLSNVLRYFDAGAERVIFGTAAIASPEVVQQAARRWPGRVAVAVDVKDGAVSVAGWTQTSGVSPLDLARLLRDWGVTRLQYTDVVRDGTLAGPDLEATERLARESGLRLTVGGGVASLDDLRRLRALEAIGVDEVVVGKALYEGRFGVAEANEAAGC